MIGILSIDLSHLVNIVVLHRIDELLDEALLELESAEKLGGVLFRDVLLVSVSVHCVASVFDELADFDVILRG